MQSSSDSSSPDEIQSAHWKQNQVSLFTAAVWYSGAIHSCVIASDNLVHTKDTVIAYLDRLLEELPREVKIVSIWSDGPSSQFKNRFVFASLPLLSEKFAINLTWNYFATSHGKGPVDGIGGSVKRYVWGKVKNRKNHVNNASTFVAAAQDMLNVEVFEMTTDSIEEKNTSLGLVQIFNHAPLVQGISRYHCAKLKNLKVIPYFVTCESDQDTTSADCVTGADDYDDSLDGRIVNPSEIQKATLHVKVKDWVLVDYEGTAYPGEIISKEGEDYEVSVMLPAGKNWKWPVKRDSILYNKNKLICRLDKPIPVNNRGCFKFRDI